MGGINLLGQTKLTIDWAGKTIKDVTPELAEVDLLVDALTVEALLCALRASGDVTVPQDLGAGDLLYNNCGGIRELKDKDVSGTVYLPANGTVIVGFKITPRAYTEKELAGTMAGVQAGIGDPGDFGAATACAATASTCTFVLGNGNEQCGDSAQQMACCGILRCLTHTSHSWGECDDLDAIEQVMAKQQRTEKAAVDEQRRQQVAAAAARALSKDAEKAAALARAERRAADKSAKEVAKAGKAKKRSDCKAAKEAKIEQRKAARAEAIVQETIQSERQAKLDIAKFTHFCKGVKQRALSKVRVAIGVQHIFAPALKGGGAPHVQMGHTEVVRLDVNENVHQASRLFHAEFGNESHSLQMRLRGIGLSVQGLPHGSEGTTATAAAIAVVMPQPVELQQIAPGLPQYTTQELHAVVDYLEPKAPKKKRNRLQKSAVVAEA